MFNYQVNSELHFLNSMIFFFLIEHGFFFRFIFKFKTKNEGVLHIPLFSSKSITATTCI